MSDSPYSLPVLMVLAAMSLLSEDVRNVSIADLRGLLRDKYRMSPAEIEDALDRAQAEGAMEINDD